MKRPFSTTGSDLIKVKELMEHKKGLHETLKLKHKIEEDEFAYCYHPH